MFKEPEQHRDFSFRCKKNVAGVSLCLSEIRSALSATFHFELGEGYFY